ncbi:hypothetical protein [Mesorhizobium sp. CAU 1741]|uniref:hypothetical protein n=1 Tax=Mesorhizobium sp. CAU 1741 TaxID=3140366 RepID=UPI00325A9C5B
MAAAAAGLTPQQMQSYCAGEAAGEFNTRPDYVSTNTALPSTSGGFVVTGTVDRGTEGNPPFECQFARSGRFISFRMI